MYVKDAMNKKVITGNAHMPLSKVLLLLQKYDISGLPIIDDAGNLIGVLSRRDIFSGTEFDTSELYHKKAKEFMTTDIQAVDSDDDLSHAAKLMLRHSVNRLPVVKDKKCVGVITRDDIIKYHYKNGRWR